MNGMDAQLPFAVARALNETAKEFQEDERALLRREFTIRKPWVEQGIKINSRDFASKTKLNVRIAVDQSRDFLNKFEQGGARLPRAGGKSLVVPLGVRPTPQADIPKSLRPKALHLKQTSKGGKFTVFKGDNGTFMVQRPDGSGIIFKRKGRAIAVKRRHQGPLMKGQRKDWKLVTLYVLRPKTPVPADLHFIETARTSFAKHWSPNFTKWWNEAVRTARTVAPIPQGTALPNGWTE